MNDFDTPDIVHQNRVLKESFRDDLGPPGIAGHQNSLAEADVVLYIDMGRGGEVGHNNHLSELS